MDDVRTLLNEIDALIAEAALGDPPPSVARIERTLTDGYARALAIEGERARIERRIAALAEELDGAGTDAKTRELATLSQRLRAAGEELSALRELLAALRRTAAAARAA